MSFKLCGTKYGGWVIDLNLIPENSTVISAGIGEDISFDIQLINKRGCNIIGVDPTIKSHCYIQSQKLNNFKLIKKALHTTDGTITIFKNKRIDYVSESILSHHESVSSDSYVCKTISLPTIFETYSDISILKLDIEGSEYDVLLSLLKIPKTIKQLCVEFHHFCCSKTISDTQTVIQHLKTLGFDKFIQKPSERKLNELTFYRDI